ncbi:MAG: glycosyltransferase family 4 protein [Anaerolineae bacterium]|nr:glycosyltransferase family 4 protein [Anaerolineae bacterium]
MSAPTRARHLTTAAPQSLAVGTVATKHHMARARVLYNSFRHYHPDIPFYLLLADMVNGDFDPAAESFPILSLQDLPILRPIPYRFKYLPFELAASLKPRLLEYLGADLGFRRMVFLDSDLLILNNLSALFRQLDDHSILLTPHLTEPMTVDGLIPDETDMLRGGTFNSGFVGVKYDAAGRAFVSWWRNRLYDGSRVEVARGLFVDQSWLDLAPGMFEGVHILRDPGCNIAYWNLYSRRIEFRDGGVCVNGEPGYFFHFSGFDADKPDVVSQHTTRPRASYEGPATPLYHKYAALLKAAGEAEVREWQYAFANFDNGVPIPPIARRMYFGLGKDASRFLDPFQTGGDDSFYNWLNGPAEPDEGAANPISRLWHELYRERAELRDAFPDLFGKDRAVFMNWAVEHGAKDLDIPTRFLAPLHRQSNLARHATMRAANPRSARALPLGVNLTGNFRSERGMGEAVRSGLANLEAAKIPCVKNNFDDLSALNTENSVTGFSDHYPYRFNLVWLNADTIGWMLEKRGAEFLRNHYNIAHWAWEVQDFPAQWAASFDWFDEIWVASRFVQKGLARVSPVPVRAVPYSVALQAPDKPNPSLVGLPRDKFIFLFIFDMSSHAARKNPRGLIRAFQKAFRKDDDALLVIKCAHSADHPRALAEMQRAALESNILITDGVVGRAQVGMLMDAADCYVSLHRAEGFGLTMAEAMLRGKPVIATGYSGNLDFMNEANSYLVRYRLTSIGQPHGPYQKDFVWAEPDLDHAAELMRHVYEDRDTARAVGARAREDVARQLNPHAVGKLMEEYLRAAR